MIKKKIKLLLISFWARAKVAPKNESKLIRNCSMRWERNQNLTHHRFFSLFEIYLLSESPSRSAVSLSHAAETIEIAENPNSKPLKYRLLYEIQYLVKLNSSKKRLSIKTEASMSDMILIESRNFDCWSDWRLLPLFPFPHSHRWKKTRRVFILLLEALIEISPNLTNNFGKHGSYSYLCSQF